MIQREVIVNKLIEFYTGKVDELANQNALIMIFRPFIDKAADKSIGKVDKFLKMIQEEDGTVDIEPLLGKMTEYLEQLCSRNVMVIPYIHICNAAGESLSFSLLNGA